MRGREGYLFDFCKVVFDVFVEGEFSEGPEGDFCLGPDFGQVEDVPAEFFGLFGGEGLDVDGPGWEVAFGDGVEEVLGVPVWVLACHLACFRVGEGLAPLVGLEVDLDVDEASVGLCELVGMSRVSVHVSEGVWCTTVREQVHNLVNSLLVSGEVVPEHGGILQVGLWVSLLGVDEEGELGRIAKEEDRRVVVNPIPVALLGIELNGEASRISRSIWGTLLSTHSRETSDGGGLLANTSEHINRGDVANIVSNFELCNMLAMSYVRWKIETHLHKLQLPLRGQHALGFAHDRNEPAGRSNGSPGAREGHSDQLSGKPQGSRLGIHWKWYRMAFRNT